jgi:hypothetical protein
MGQIMRYVLPTGSHVVLIGLQTLFPRRVHLDAREHEDAKPREHLLGERGMLGGLFSKCAQNCGCLNNNRNWLVRIFENTRRTIFK